ISPAKRQRSADFEGHSDTLILPTDAEKQMGIRAHITLKNVKGTFQITTKTELQFSKGKLVEAATVQAMQKGDHVSIWLYGGPGKNLPTNAELVIVFRARQPALPPVDNKPPEKPAPLKGDAAKFQGVWDVVEMETMGTPLQGGNLTPTWVKFDGNSYEYMQGEGTNVETRFKGKFTLKESTKPKQVDLHYTERKTK